MRKREDLFDSDHPEEKTTETGQDEDFFFEIKEDESLETEPQDEPVIDEPLVTQVADTENKSGGSRQRILLLLLLLIVLLGAGYFFMGDMLFSPEPVPEPKVVKQQPQKQKIPERKVVQQEQKAVEEVVMPADKVAAAPAEEKTASQEEETAIAETPEEKVSEPAPTETTEMQQTQLKSKKPVVAEPPVEERVMEQATESSSVAIKPEVEKKTEAVVAVEKAPYVLQVGAFVLESNMERTLKLVKSLGYDPFILEGKKKVAMTRLRVGAYPEKVAREKLNEIKQLVPSAFLLHEGDQLVLYAGSYYGLDRARVSADKLYQHEIIVTEEQVDISIPIKTLRFGDFPDSAAAEAVAVKAKEAGLGVLVVKQN